jgi:hypothetical protein
LRYLCVLFPCASSLYIFGISLWLNWQNQQHCNCLPAMKTPWQLLHFEPVFMDIPTPVMLVAELEQSTHDPVL